MRELTGKSKILNKLVAVIGRDKVDALLAEYDERQREKQGQKRQKDRTGER